MTTPPIDPHLDQVHALVDLLDAETQGLRLRSASSHAPLVSAVAAVRGALAAVEPDLVPSTEPAVVLVAGLPTPTPGRT